MLETLIVKDFALSEHNTLEFNHGMSAITGETGAGKSLTVDALSVLTGSRADANMVRSGAKNAELSAVFSFENNQKVKDFLDNLSILTEDNQLLLRRVISAEGKSKAYINNTPCTVSQLKELGSCILAIHGQHASVKLIENSNQMNLLDSFGHIKDQLNKTDEVFNRYNQLRSRLQKLSEEQISGAAQYKTLRFELDALEKLDLHEGDYERISVDYDALEHQSKAQDAIALAQAVLENDEHNILDIISARISDLSAVSVYAKESIEPIITDFADAASLLDEAREKLDSLSLKANPALAEELSEKLSKCHELGRRFNVQPNELYKVKERLEKDLEHFLSLKDEITTLTSEVKKLRDEYENEAKLLSGLRADAALKMSAEVTAKIKDLAMENGIFKVMVTRDEECRPRKGGRDNIEFLFTANVGEEPKPLGTVASGGELSRLALAIEVLTSSENSTETLIFDEVDTGISGRTASSVGALLRQLGSHVQVITVTHLPQVAASAHQQFLVNKEQGSEYAHSHVFKLDEEGRVEELSRMMGGNVITEATKESARALLKESGV